MSEAKVPVYFPERMWAQLTVKADERGVRVAPMLAAAVMELTQQWESRSHRVQVLARAGLPDQVIAERTGETRKFVGDARRDAGIPANRFRRSAW